MNILLVDDEPKALRQLEKAVAAVFPDEMLHSFRRAREAMTYAAQRQVDIAFLDINMRVQDGVTMAKLLQELNPRVNIIFCTGYDEYMGEAFKLYSSGYLLKPIREVDVREAVAHLRYPPEQKKSHRIRLQCFGNFGAFCDGLPIHFKYQRTLELLAYLVDRKGVLCTTQELSGVLFGEDSHREYLYKLRQDLLSTFGALGQEEVILRANGQLGIDRQKVDCDYYDFLAGSTGLYRGEYMAQYEFAAQTRAVLEEKR